MTDRVEQSRGGGETETLRELADRFNRAFYQGTEETWAETRWLGVRTARYPTDLIILAEILAETAPELVVESGVFEGGGTLFIATVLAALDGEGGEGRVIGIDVDLSRVPDRVRAHPRVELIEGSSTDPTVVSRLLAASRGRRTMVILDSDHEAGHVLEELRRLAPLVSEGCYLLVEDTAVGGRPVLPEHPPGPADALHAFREENDRFAPDLRRERFALTTNPGGYLLRLAEDEEPPPELGVDPAGEPLEGPTDGFAPHPVRDEIASLRRAVVSMSERDRVLRAQWVERARRAQAEMQAAVAGLHTQLAHAAAIAAEKDRELEVALRRIRRLEGLPPVRAWQKLRGKLGLDRLRYREVGPGADRRRRAAGER